MTPPPHRSGRELVAGAARRYAAAADALDRAAGGAVGVEEAAQAALDAGAAALLDAALVAYGAGREDGMTGKRGPRPRPRCVAAAFAGALRCGRPARWRHSPDLAFCARHRCGRCRPL